MTKFNIPTDDNRFSDIHGMVYLLWVPERQTINKCSGDGRRANDSTPYKNLVTKSQEENISGLTSRKRLGKCLKDLRIGFWNIRSLYRNKGLQMLKGRPNLRWIDGLEKGLLVLRTKNCQVIYSQFGLAIHQNDHQARRRFVEWAQSEIAAVPDFHKRILFSDEAHFWLNGYVNKQNCRIWSEANPQVYVETPLHPEKLTVWCALWTGGILLQKR
ncbi:DUF4817 domain-containing protein [Trichonephila clavipes]|nr:DUF4817 domain-containing protein [Trichonephila clavipes]